MRRAMALGIVAMLALAGCSRTDDGTQTGEGGETADGLTVVATEYAFDIPDEITGGIVDLTLDNQGEQDHEAAFILVDEDYDIDSFAADFGPVVEGGPIPASFKSAVSISEAEAGEQSTGTITLPEGTYVLFCSLEDNEDEDQVGEDDPMGDAEGEDTEGEDTEGEDTEGEDAEGEDEAPDAEATGAASTEGEDVEGDAAGDDAGEAAEGEEAPEGDGADDETMHFELGMIELITVTGGADVTAEDMPENDGVVTASDYAFEVPELEAGEHTLTFVNASEEQIHHAVFFEFAEGVDEAAAKDTFTKMMSAGEGPPPEGVTPPDEAGYAAVTGPAFATTFELTLKAGRTYAAVCFIQDRTGGPPHAVAHNMATFFTVS